MLTGPLTAAPSREKRRILAVINHVSVSARGFLPLHRADRGPLVIVSLWGGPHPIPRRIGNRVPLRADCLARKASLRAACFPPGGGVTTAAAGLRAGGGGIFLSGTIRHEFGDQAVRDVSESFHANQHGGDNVSNQGNAFPVSRNEGPRS